MVKISFAIAVPSHVFITTINSNCFSIAVLAKLILGHYSKYFGEYIESRKVVKRPTIEFAIFGSLTTFLHSRSYIILIFNFLHKFSIFFLIFQYFSCCRSISKFNFSIGHQIALNHHPYQISFYFIYWLSIPPLKIQNTNPDIPPMLPHYPVHQYFVHRIRQSNKKCQTERQLKFLSPQN